MKKLTSLAFSVTLAATLVACNFPSTSGTLPVAGNTATPANLIQTRIPPPVTAALVPTQIPLPVVQKTSSPVASVVAARISPIPTLTISPTPACDRASAGNPIDISVPDNATFEPGAAFTKTWRLVNSGSCTWTTDYAAVWFSGETLGASTTNLTGTVPPGKSIDISVDMFAPQQPGAYQSYWKMENKAGKLFGIGPNGDAPFWVRIVVAQPQATALETSPAPEIPSPKVYANGLANLTNDDGLDLDQVQINQGKADDLIYQQNENRHQIVPANGAQFVQIGKGQPSIADCQSAGLAADPQLLDDIPSGTYFCYKTNLGLPGWARLMYINPKDQVLTIEILTWSTP